MLKKKTNGAWSALSTVKKKINGVWSDCSTVKKKINGSWSNVWRKYTYSIRSYASSRSDTYEKMGFDEYSINFDGKGATTINLSQTKHDFGDYGTMYVAVVYYSYSAISIKPGESIYFDYSYTTSSNEYSFYVGVADKITAGPSVTVGTGLAGSINSPTSNVLKLTNNRSSTITCYMFIQMQHSWSSYYASAFNATITLNRIYTDSEQVIWQR